MTVSGYANYTAIDNLNVCQSTSVASVEVTQAIQQYQSLADLKTSLTANQEPPVPIIAGKPAVLRTYLNPTQAVSNITVALTGVATGSQTVSLNPSCTPAQQRGNLNNCQSVDFYFTPPAGTWTANLTVTDGSGTQLDQQTLSFKSRSTNALRLVGEQVCDAKDSSGNWLCQDPNNLLNKTSLLGRIAPTNSVIVAIGSDPIQQDVTKFPTSGGWATAVASQVNSLYSMFGQASDLLLGRYTTYMGVVRPAPQNGPGQAPPVDPLGGFGGQANSIPSHGAAARAAFYPYQYSNPTVLGIDTSDDVVAHETGHTLGLFHTGTQIPSNTTAPAGCWGLAAIATTDWRFPTGVAGSPANTNYIQSSSTGGTLGTAVYEVGFDVAGRKPLNPAYNFELMGYCTPYWITPQRYKTMIATLGGGAVTSPSEKPGSPVASVSRPDLSPVSAVIPAAAPFWVVSGTVTGSTVAFDPLFQMTIQGDTSTEAGTYSLLLEDASGKVLFTRLFVPMSPTTDGTGSTTSTSQMLFSQTLPVTANTSAIVMLDATSAEVARITLAGTAPAVAVVSPTSSFGGSGTQTVSWTVKGPAAYTSIVQYSANNGATWSQVAKVANALSVPINFDLLAGGSQSLIQVLVSDGVNTGSAMSPVFSVAKKKPTVIMIASPTANFVQPASAPMYLSGSVFDVDDGVLSGSALQWTDNVSGTLGSGSPLTVTKLAAGSHTLTLTGTDSDGNSLSSTVNVLMAGQPPVVALSVTALNSAPTTCAYATVTATPGAVAGVNLASVQFSVDGGATYTAIPIGSLPYGFVVPGSGFVHIVATATDLSGQSNSKDTTFFTNAVCTLKTQTITFGTLNNTTFSKNAIALNASASSGLGVTFTVNGAATLSGTNLTLTGVGTVTVTATQAGSSTYSPATVSQTFVVSQGVPAIAWVSPAPILYGTTLSSTLNALASLGGSSLPGSYAYTAQTSGGSPVSVTGTTVLAAGTYTIAVAFTPTDAVDYSSAAASVALTVADFSLGSATVAAQTVKAGSTASFSFPVASVGTPSTLGAIQFAATGLPTGATAVFTPATLPSGSAATNVTMTIQTSATAENKSLKLFRSREETVLMCFFFLPLPLLLRKRRTLMRKSVLTLLLLATSQALISGCSSGGGSSTVQPKTYTVTVTATAGVDTHTTSVALTVD